MHDVERVQLRVRGDEGRRNMAEVLATSLAMLKVVRAPRVNEHDVCLSDSCHHSMEVCWLGLEISPPCCRLPWRPGVECSWHRQSAWRAPAHRWCASIGPRSADQNAARPWVARGIEVLAIRLGVASARKSDAGRRGRAVGGERGLSGRCMMQARMRAGPAPPQLSTARPPNDRLDDIFSSMMPERGARHRSR